MLDMILHQTSIQLRIRASSQQNLIIIALEFLLGLLSLFDITNGSNIFLVKIQRDIHKI